MPYSGFDESCRFCGSLPVEAMDRRPSLSRSFKGEEALRGALFLGDAKDLVPAGPYLAEVVERLAGQRACSGPALPRACSERSASIRLDLPAADEALDEHPRGWTELARDGRKIPHQLVALFSDQAAALQVLTDALDKMWVAQKLQGRLAPLLRERHGLPLLGEGFAHLPLVQLLQAKEQAPQVALDDLFLHAELGLRLA